MISLTSNFSGVEIGSAFLFEPEEVAYALGTIAEGRDASFTEDVAEWIGGDKSMVSAFLRDLLDAIEAAE